ncbi:excalibur calcium-binding domain-containing protein [Streptomyces sp. NPDC006450]|uniref:excalibur calcium-binding domain-containing protein n=1 Tax=Streptomyces sp. NPDC006450 TaxID=3155458 RepID=UPI0033A07BDB
MTAMAAAVALSLAGCGDTAAKSSDKPGPAPSPTSPGPVMPALVGKTASEAESLVKKLSDTPVEVRGAYSDVELSRVHTMWLVCFQTPAAGAPLPPGSAAEISLTGPGTPCPAQAGAALRPVGTPTPTRTPVAGATGKPKPPASSPTPAPAPDDVSYKNCTEAKAAGAAPIRRGQPGYGKHLDRDDDGIACDK